MTSNAPSAGKARHTPTPWTAYGENVAKDGELLFQTLRGSRRQLPIISNRDFILRAANCHQELCDALEDCFRWLAGSSERKKCKAETLLELLNTAATALAKARTE